MEASDFRRIQEELANWLKGGYYKSMVEAHKAIFDEYVKVGFSRDEALRLIMSIGGGEPKE